MQVFGIRNQPVKYTVATAEVAKGTVKTPDGENSSEPEKMQTLFCKLQSLLRGQQQKPALTAEKSAVLFWVLGIQKHAFYYSCADIE